VRPTVRIAFDLNLAGAGDFFTLDDTLKGRLGGGTVTGAFTLAGDVLTDVSDDVRSVSIRRGRPRELQAFTAGQASVVLDNRTRLYDPTAGTAVSPYGPSILPRKALSIELGGVPVYNGQVEDIDLNYSLSGDSVTTFKASDGFTLLSGVNLAPGTGVPQGSGARVTAVLDEVNWPAGKRFIDTGVASLGADAIGENTAALAYLQTVEASEAGFLFIGKDGSFTFRERTSSQVTPVIEFADDLSGLPYSDIEIEYGTEALFTQVNVEYLSGTATVGTVTAASTAQQLNYGVTELTVKTLLDGVGEADDLAEFYLFRYSVPTLRVTSLTVDVEALTDVEQTDLLAVDLGEGALITFTPNGIGDPIVRTVVVDSIEHSISPGKHTVKLSFSDNLVGFILDTDQLDVGRLGF
jgi:hypothetical protein